MALQMLPECLQRSAETMTWTTLWNKQRGQEQLVPGAARCAALERRTPQSQAPATDAAVAQGEPLELLRPTSRTVIGEDDILFDGDRRYRGGERRGTARRGGDRARRVFRGGCGARCTALKGIVAGLNHPVP